MKTLDQLTNIPQQERRAAQLGGLAVRGEREQAQRHERKFREVVNVLAGLAGLAIALALIGGLVYAAVAVDPHSGKDAEIMIRARFQLTQDDMRPLEWPIKHPYWCTGYGSNDCPIIVAYADSVAEIERLWPDAERPIAFTEATEYTFTSRFPKPDWFAEQETQKL